MGNKNDGLFKKYDVNRIDGKIIKDGCLVLEFKDELAHSAIEEYAYSVGESGNGQLKLDIINHLESVQSLKK